MANLKLVSFSISPYRSCINTRLPLHDDLTALIGINGAGKSNILNGLLFLNKIKRNRRRRYDTYIINSRIRNKTNGSANKSCHINAEFILEKKRIFMKGYISYETDEQNNDEIISSRIKWNFREFTKDKKWYEVDHEFLFSTQMFDRNFKNRRDFLYKAYANHNIDFFTFIPNNKKEVDIIGSINNFFSGISYYSASQFSNPSQCPVSIELGENRVSTKIGSNSGHEQFILDLYKSYKANEPQYKRYLSIVNNEGIGLLQNIRFIEVKIPSSSYKIQAGLSIKTTKKDRLLIVPVFTIDKSKLSPNQVSEGTFKTLALLFYLLTDSSRLLLIEEPEVCVHHGLLKSIISIIKQESKTKQIIISTHSDYVLDQLSPENIVLVKKINKTGTEAKLLTKSMSSNDYKVLRSYLEDSGNLGDYLKESGLK